MSELQFFNSSEIHWFHKEQARERAHGFCTPAHPLDEFPTLFANKGYDLSQGSTKVYKASEADKARAIEERKAVVSALRKRENLFDTLGVPLVGALHTVTLFQETDIDTGKETARKVSYQELADIYEAQWTSGKGKARKWLAPDVIAVFEYRRGLAYPASVHAYCVHTAGRTATDTAILFPAQVVEFANEREKLHARWLENVRPGTAAYSPVDKLGCGLALLDIDPSALETELQHGLRETRGTAQKIHTWATLARLYPALKLFERFSMPMPELAQGAKLPPYKRGGWLPFSAVNAGHARTLLGLARKSPIAEIVAIMAEDKATAEEVEEFFERVLWPGRTNAVAMLDKKRIANIVTGLDTSNDIQNAMVIALTAVLTGDSGPVERARKASIDTPLAVDKSGKATGKAKK